MCFSQISGTFESISRGRVLNIGVAYNELNMHIAHIMNATEYRMVYYVGFSIGAYHLVKLDILSSLIE